eukprot:CAMPEP_0182541772 /NCGR_PEP_ID=MMETSP1323-20130603/29137_1 /TAXON_ID=236787 /ORGANISM="Florenciella parvula, Strain RCC1693" /LENGTH=40 /DNA_ID= /DNA_START= /DNA_END= /DNA_ORIENTATION=
MCATSLIDASGGIPETSSVSEIAGGGPGLLPPPPPTPLPP